MQAPDFSGAIRAALTPTVRHTFKPNRHARRAAAAKARRKAKP